MTKIDIVSGFLGAGKTTLIKKLIAEAYSGEKLVLIENEFGEIGIDGGFLQEAGVTVTEMNSGCICCSLTGDFREALRMVLAQYSPDRVIIEPSGVGKLSDIVAAVLAAGEGALQLGALTTVADATRAKMYMKNFGEFYNNQIQSANCIVLSRTGGMAPDALARAEALLREQNPEAIIVSTPWEELTGRQLLEAMEKKNSVSQELGQLLREQEELECDDPDCSCHHHHDHEHEHHHHEHHHEHDHHHEHEHEHDHDHHHHDHGHECDDPNCSCHHDYGHHHHHHGHDADEVFQSWGAETAKQYTAAEIGAILDRLGQEEAYGLVLRAKGYVASPEGGWVHFDYTPGEKDVRPGGANVAGRVCVIGSRLQETAIKELFGL